MENLKISHRRPLPRFDHAARLRVGRGKARRLLQQANAKHTRNDMRSSGSPFTCVQACQKCDLRDIHAKKRVCLRRVASRQFRQMGKWICNALLKRMLRLKKIRVEREMAKEFIHRSIASSVREILMETGTGAGELCEEECNELDSLD